MGSYTVQFTIKGITESQALAVLNLLKSKLQGSDYSIVTSGYVAEVGS